MPNPILARADALMSRRRQSADEVDELPVLTDVVDDTDDIPVLTDFDTPPTSNLAPAIGSPAVVDWPPPIAPPLADTPAFVTPTLSADELVHELARRIEQRILAEIPRVIESTVRDYLAEQEIIADQQHGH